MFKHIFLFLLLMPIISHADGSATGKIAGYAINENHIYVQSISTIANTPTCNGTNRFYFSQSETYAKVFLSSILAAYQAGTELVLTGTGDCNGGNSEVLRKICTVGFPC